MSEETAESEIEGDAVEVEVAVEGDAAEVEGDAVEAEGDAVEVEVAVEGDAAGDAVVGDAPSEDVSVEADPSLVNTVESLLFLSQDPLGAPELAEATLASDEQVAAALNSLAERHVEGSSGLRVKEVGGGFTLASAPESEDAARRLFSKPRVATLTPAQTETLAIVAYLQPVSRPEIGRIRGVSADSATAALLERGLIEEAGRSQFGAALYRTTNLFLKLFGLKALADLPEVAKWDPTPEETAELRDRLLRAGDARSGNAPSQD